MSTPKDPQTGPKADLGPTAPRARPPVEPPTVRLARKTQSLDILYAIATGLSQPGSLDQLLDGFLDTLVELVDARAASVRLVTTDGHTRLIASRGLAPEVVERDRLMPAGRCLCSWASSEGGLRVQRGTASCAALIGRPMLERDCAEFVVVPVQLPGPHPGRIQPVSRPPACRHGRGHARSADHRRPPPRPRDRKVPPRRRGAPRRDHGGAQHHRHRAARFAGTVADRHAPATARC